MLPDEAIRVLSVGILAVAGLILMVWIVNVYRKTNFTPAQFPIYMLNLFMTRVQWRTEVVGSVRLPPGQGAVIVCNHRGPIDPAFVALACDQPVHWMVAREFVRHPAVGWGLRILQVIPVGRAGIDTAAMRLAIRYARQGGLVGMFPEGHINFTDRLLLPGRLGAALVALKARVPVIPCYISGSPNDGTPFGFLIMTARTKLVVGQPIDISAYYGRDGEREALEELTKRFLVEIARLAGVPDYQPELAGKQWKHRVPRKPEKARR